MRGCSITSTREYRLLLKKNAQRRWETRECQSRGLDSMRCWLISLLTDEGERPSNLAIDRAD